MAAEQLPSAEHFPSPEQEPSPEHEASPPGAAAPEAGASLPEVGAASGVSLLLPPQAEEVPTPRAAVARASREFLSVGFMASPCGVEREA